ncbi:hypothetical protein Tco_0120352, partial [Tanacetum coccineum]
FGVRVTGGGETILHVVNRLIEDRLDDVGLSMLLVELKNAFNWWIGPSFDVVGGIEKCLQLVDRAFVVPLFHVRRWIWLFTPTSQFSLYFEGIKKGCGSPPEADPKVLYGSRH